MKTLKTIVFILVSFGSAYAQNNYTPRVATGAPLVGGRNMDMNLTWRAIDVSAFEGVEGSPFLTDEYHRAFLKTKNGVRFENVWVRFNAFSNEILLQNESQLMALTNVDSLAYTMDVGKKNIIFKTGYPAIDGQDNETIYQILAYRENFQFLKYPQKKVETLKKMGLPDQRVFVAKPIYYFYNLTNNSIIRVRLNKKSILNALSGISNVENSLSAGKVDFKRESEVVAYINSIQMRN
ncbi:hypothetical protein ABDK00_015605 [Niabella insulamsoli]|uniref:hypothetical protein n=1 Tax=Niabella insulamsoli TaxID=3144874 RepID=UPI0031FC4C4B